MHEMSFAESILRVVSRASRENGRRPVTRVVLKVGKMSGVDPASLRYCLDAIASGSAMEGAKIDVVEVAPGLVCARCGRLPIGEARAPVCPKCGGPAEVSPATDLYVEEIELNDEEDTALDKD